MEWCSSRPATPGQPCRGIYCWRFRWTRAYTKRWARSKKMRNLLRSALLFAAGIAVGVLLMQPGLAQQGSAQVSGLRLNHVGIYAKDFDESMRFYTQVLGFKEAFTIRDNAGKPTLAYLHITRDTFLEVAPA